VEALSNLNNIRSVFEEESSRHGLKGVLGVAAFDSVYESLLPVQQELLKGLAGKGFEGLMDGGSVISIAYAYPEHAIDSIAVKKGEGFDKETWNVYAREYRRLNEALNEACDRLAQEVDGIPLPATTSGIAAEIEHVEDYYGMAVSHRVAAERAGIGWRGKNELIVHPGYSCAIRLASVVTEVPLERTAPSEGGCGDCRACLDACNFLRYKDRLDNYREQCRRYIVALGLEGEVCGMCVRACYRDSVYSDRFRL